MITFRQLLQNVANQHLLQKFPMTVFDRQETEETTFYSPPKEALNFGDDVDAPMDAELFFERLKGKEAELINLGCRRDSIVVILDSDGDLKFTGKRPEKDHEYNTRIARERRERSSAGARTERTHARKVAALKAAAEELGLVVSKKL